MADDTTAIIPAGLSNASISLPNGQTRYFLVNNNRSDFSFLSSTSGGVDGDKEMNIIFLLHPSSRIDSSDPYTPASVFEALTRQRLIDAATSAFNLEDSKNELLLVYLASRDIGNGWWCWGAGSDNNLCSSPVDGSDSDFFKEALMHVKKSLAPSTRAKVFLFGYSGGARMAWRLACDPEISNLLDGVSMAAGLLPTSLQNDFDEDEKFIAEAESSSCRVDQLPPSVVVLHGDLDTTTNVEFANQSIEWVARSADCELTGVRVIGNEILEEYSNCTNNDRRLILSYYRRVGGLHITPDKDQMQRIFENWQASYIPPSNQPSALPSLLPSGEPSATLSPSSSPTTSPSLSAFPSVSPISYPSISPSYAASDTPSSIPSDKPSATSYPSIIPTASPSISLIPTSPPSESPSKSYFFSLANTCSSENILQMNSFLQNFQDREFYLVDLYNFRNQAIYEDGRDATGAQAVHEYTNFLVDDILPDAGAQLVFNLTSNSLPEWDEIQVVKYPNAAMFKEHFLKNSQVEEMRTHMTAGLRKHLTFATSLVENIPSALLDGITHETMLRDYPKARDSFFREFCSTNRCPENSYCIVHNEQVQNSFALDKADGTFFTCHCESGYDCEPDEYFLSSAMSNDPTSILFHVLQFVEPDGRSLVGNFDDLTSIDKYRYGLKPLAWLEVEAMCVGEQSFDQIRFESVPSFKTYGELINKNDWIEASKFREEGITSQSYSSFTTPVLFSSLYQILKRVRGQKRHD